MTIKQRTEIERSVAHMVGHLYQVQDLCRHCGAPEQFVAEWGYVFDVVNKLLMHARRLPVTDPMPEPSPKPPTYTGD